MNEGSEATSNPDKSTIVDEWLGDEVVRDEDFPMLYLFEVKSAFRPIPERLRPFMMLSGRAEGIPPRHADLPVHTCAQFQEQ